MLYHQIFQILFQFLRTRRFPAIWGEKKSLADWFQTHLIIFFFFRSEDEDDEDDPASLEARFGLSGPLPADSPAARALQQLSSKPKKSILKKSNSYTIHAFG